MTTHHIAVMSSLNELGAIKLCECRTTYSKTESDKMQFLQI